MNRLFRALVVAAGFGILPAAASADTFLLIQGVAGDSADPSHKNWIRVASLEWGATMPAITNSTGGSATVNRAAGKSLKLTIPTGTWSREFLNNLTRGIPFSQIVIDHVNPDGRPAYRVTIGNFILSSYLNAPTAKSPAQDEIEGLIGNYKAEFYSVGADGRVTSSTVGWNFVTNTGTP